MGTYIDFDWLLTIFDSHLQVRRAVVGTVRGVHKVFSISSFYLNVHSTLEYS